MKKLKYLIFLFIVLVCPSVLALDVTNYIQYNTDYSTGTYKGDEIALGGYSGPYSVKTRYQGRLSFIEFVFSSDYYSFDTNTTYTITLNMATNDWRNNFMGPQVIKLNLDGSVQATNSSLSVSNFQFVSRKTIKFNFKTNGTLSPYLLFRLYSTDYASTNHTAITGDSNWNLNSITIDKYTTSSGGSGNTGSGSTITNTNITCSNGLSLSTKNFNANDISIFSSYLNSSGVVVSNTGYGIIANIPINANTNYVLTKTTNTGDVPSYCLSSSNNSYGSCVSYNQRNSIAFNSGSSTYLSFSIRTDETITLGTCVSPVDNQNQNTQDIINNQNQNTTNIIENNNDNTQQIIDSNKVCERLGTSVVEIKNSYLNQSGGIVYNNPYFQGISRFITINPSTTIKVLSKAEIDGNYLCFYTSNKIKISCLNQYQFQTDELLTIPNNAKYFRYTLLNSKPSLYVCSNGNESINDTLTDDSVDDKSSFFSGFTNDDHGLSSIITIPLNTIQQLTSSSCVPLSVPIPFTNSNVNLPCMTEVYETHIPTIYNIWQVVSFGIIAYFICLDIFRMVKGFKDPQEDKVEVLDL